MDGERHREDPKLFNELMLRYHNKKSDRDEETWMMRFWNAEYWRTETLGTRWTKQVSTVRAPSGAQRNRQIQTANTALKEYTEQWKRLHR